MARPAACRLCGRGFERRERHGRRVYCEQCTARADKAIAGKLHVKCKECGKALATTSHRVRYCSKACSAEYARHYNREYQRKALADPAKRAIILARVRASAAARAARKRGGRPLQRQAPMRVDPDAEPSTCRLCGRSFAQYGNTNRHAYCRQCTARANKAITEKLHVKCKECGKEFTTTNRSARYCSDECRTDGTRRSRRECRLRRMADPEKRATAAAYARAQSAARKVEKQGDAGRAA